ncbi:MAG: ATP-binding response regulator, partial [Myxococcaceae bacterium]
HAVVVVADIGVGLDAATRARLVQPFVPGDRSLDRGCGGLGLGLALVKGLVELHGGEVGVFSDGLGTGTRFTLKLPVQEAEVEAAPMLRASAAPQRAGAAARRVLVVEDNEDAADSLREVLEIAGHQVAVAHDGLEGLAKARELFPQIILCDIGLPVMDGYALARALRRDASLSSTFLVALTGYARPEDVRRAHEAGFDRHLAKPPALETLDRVIAETPVRDVVAGAGPGS